MLIANVAASFFGGLWLTGINRDASGNVAVPNLPVWAGAVGLNGPGTSGSTCADWSMTGANGATSVSSQAYGNTQIGTGTRSCSSTVGSVRLYCLQQ